MHRVHRRLSPAVLRLVSAKLCIVSAWVGSLLFAGTVQAQPIGAQRIGEVLRNTPRSEIHVVDSMQAPPETYCRLRVDYVSGKVAHVGVARRNVDQPTTLAASFSVTYNGFPAAYEEAVQRAIDTWALLLSSSIPIAVDATFEANPDPNVLASAGPNTFWLLQFGNGTCGVTTDLLCLWAGDALADALLDSDLNPGSPDINVSVNSNFANWHTGSGAPSSSDFDLESVMLHELGHGLNFTGFFSYDDQGTPTTTDDEGFWGAMASGGRGPFSDFYGFSVYDASSGGNPVIDTGVYTNPSSALAGLFTSTDLYFDGSGFLSSSSVAVNNNGGARPELYAPASWSPGSSLSHLDEASFNATNNALMTPAIAPGEQARAPGSVTCGLMEDMGWTVAQTTCANLTLPVELTAFDAVADGRDVLLTWATASEANNAGFEVQIQSPTSEIPKWKPLAWVDGAGTTLEAQTYTYRLADLEPGPHAFRLKQIDYDGAFEYSPEVEVFIELPAAYALSAAYPNPFNPQTQFTLMVAARQHVTVDVFDVTGRRVARLHDGPLAADQLHRFTHRFPGSHLTPPRRA